MRGIVYGYVVDIEHVLVRRSSPYVKAGRAFARILDTREQLNDLQDVLFAKDHGNLLHGFHRNTFIAHEHTLYIAVPCIRNRDLFQLYEILVQLQIQWTIRQHCKTRFHILHGHVVDHNGVVTGIQFQLEIAIYI